MMYLSKSLLMLKQKKLKTLKHHIIVCMASSSKCCDPVLGNTAVEFLKKRIKHYNLDKNILVTRAACLGICVSGPIVVVYPEGIWYHSCNLDVIEEIIVSHLINGNILEKHAFSRNIASGISMDMLS